VDVGQPAVRLALLAVLQVCALVPVYVCECLCAYADVLLACCLFLVGQDTMVL
jgi:hypothetical protein